jgi:transposase InsO family protein
VLAVKMSTLSEWNQIFDDRMNPVILPDGRGKATKVTSDIVRDVVEAAKELKGKGRRIRIKSFTKELKAKHKIVLSAKKVAEILTANGLYKAVTRKRRPRFYQRLRQSIPNGLISADGSEFTVWIDGIQYKFNLELCVDVESFYHGGFSVSDTETTEELIKVIEEHKELCGSPLGLVCDHGSGNLSDGAMDYLKRNDIEILPAGPGNPKGNGTCEGAFSEMKKVIGVINLKTLSPRELAITILEKIVSIYIIMRNRLARVGDKKSPQETIKRPVSEEQRRHEKARQKNLKKKQEDPSRQAKLDRIDWIINYYGLLLDEATLNRARKTIVTYDIEAITKSEEAFITAIRRNQQRRNLAYFFGILKRIQQEIDDSKYETYCTEHYNYQQILERENEKKKAEERKTTVESVADMLGSVVNCRFREIKEVATKRAKLMILDLKKQYRYDGVLKGKIADALRKMNELNITKRNEALELVNQFLT